MQRILLLSALTALFAAPLAAQTTQTGSVTITIGLVGILPSPSCKVSTSLSTLDFGTATASGTKTTTKTGSTTVTVTSVTAQSDRVRTVGFGVPMKRTPDTGDRVGAQLRVGSPTCTGERTIGNDTWIVGGTCDYPITGTARIPAQGAPGTYTGSATVSVSCF